MELAYERLPDELKERIEGRYAIHSHLKTFGRGMTDKERAEAAEEHPDQKHPIVRTHPVTGRRSLFVNRPFTATIDGMDPDEARTLLRPPVPAGDHAGVPGPVPVAPRVDRPVGQPVHPALRGARPRRPSSSDGTGDPGRRPPGLSRPGSDSSSAGRPEQQGVQVIDITAELDEQRLADLNEVIRTRRSVRSFEPGHRVDRRVLEGIAEAGRWAPSGRQHPTLGDLHRRGARATGPHRPDHGRPGRSAERPLQGLPPRPQEALGARRHRHLRVVRRPSLVGRLSGGQRSGDGRGRVRGQPGPHSCWCRPGRRPRTSSWPPPRSASTRPGSPGAANRRPPGSCRPSWASPSRMCRWPSSRSAGPTAVTRAGGGAPSTR